VRFCQEKVSGLVKVGSKAKTRSRGEESVDRSGVRAGWDGGGRGMEKSYSGIEVRRLGR